MIPPAQDWFLRSNLSATIHTTVFGLGEVEVILSTVLYKVVLEIEFILLIRCKEKLA